MKLCFASCRRRNICWGYWNWVQFRKQYDRKSTKWYSMSNRDRNENAHTQQILEKCPYKFVDPDIPSFLKFTNSLCFPHKFWMWKSNLDGYYWVELLCLVLLIYFNANSDKVKAWSGQWIKKLVLPNFQIEYKNYRNRYIHFSLLSSQSRSHSWSILGSF